LIGDREDPLNDPPQSVSACYGTTLSYLFGLSLKTNRGRHTWMHLSVDPFW